MTNEVERLTAKESALISVLDEMAIIKQTGKANAETLANVAAALLSYPNKKQKGQTRSENVADCSAAASIHLVKLCSYRKAQNGTLWLVEKMLCDALGLLQRRLFIVYDI